MNPIAELVLAALRNDYSQWNYYVFCRNLGLREDDTDRHSVEQWQAFQSLIRDIDTLGTNFDKLLERGGATAQAGLTACRQELGLLPGPEHTPT